MRVVVIVGSRVGVESASEVVLVLVVIVVEAGDGSARVNSRSSRSRRTSGDSTSTLQDADASVVCEGKKVLLLLDVAPAAWARERAAAGVEDTAAWAGRKELSEGVWFRLNVVELGPGVADADADGLSGVEGSSSCWVITCVSEEVVVDGSCMEERLSEVGMWTWAACSKKEVQN